MVWNCFQKTLSMPQGTLLGSLLFIVLINSCREFDRNLSVAFSIANPSKRFKLSTLCAKFIGDFSIRINPN